MDGGDTDDLISTLNLDRCRFPGTDLSRKSTLGVGVETDLFFQPETLEELHRIRSAAQRLNRDLTVIGGGSNLLFTRRARETFLVELSGDRFTSVDLNNIDGRFRIDAGAGKPLPPLVRRAVDEGWYTFGRLTGIPGTVGGAIYGNSGTRKGEIGDFVSEVYVLHPERPEEMKLEDPEFRYRWSSAGRHVILRTVLEGKNRPEDRAEPPHERIQKNRRESQPISERSAGCMFKNPKDDSAGRLIDEAGLKGHSVGNVRVSERHANFVINEGNATPEEVIHLIDDVRRQVQDAYGIDLEREIQVI